MITTPLGQSRRTRAWLRSDVHGWAWVSRVIRGSERDGLIRVVVDRLADQVVAWPQAGDQPRLLGERAVWREHAHGDGDAVAIVGEARIVALAAGVLPAPELLGAAPGLKVPRERLVQ